MTFREFKEQINGLTIPEDAVIQEVDINCYEGVQIVAHYSKNMDEWIIVDALLYIYPDSSEEDDSKE